MSTTVGTNHVGALNDSIGSYKVPKIFLQELLNDPIKMFCVFRCLLEAEDISCEILPKLFHGIAINLKDCKLTIPFEIESLGLFLVYTKCCGLILSDCQIGDNGVTLLQRYLCSDKKQEITVLDLMGNNITKASLPLIGDIIAHVKPRTLKLGCNEFACSMESITRAVCTSTLKELNLWGCSLTSQDAKGISFMMTILEELIISNNNLSDDGVEILSEGLTKTSSLRVLYISDNNIGPSGTISIAHALLVNTSLEVLNMTNNKIGLDGATAIADAIMKNKVLTELSLYGNNTLDEDSAILLLEEVYNCNNTITKMGLCKRLASNNCIKSYMENITVRRLRYCQPDVKFSLY